jgi:hypothetical protein
VIKNLIIFALLALISATSFARENSGKLVLRKKFKDFSTSFETDYRRNESYLKYRHYDLGVKIPFWQSWATAINYRSVYEFNSDKNKWELEKRPHISLYKTFKTDLVKIQLKTRQEYRYKTNDTQSARNRVRIIAKSTKEIFKLKPFIGNEFFYDMDKEKYNKNWLFGGVDFPKNKLGNFSLYYKHATELDDNDDWKADYSFVLKTVYEF